MNRFVAVQECDATKMLRELKLVTKKNKMTRPTIAITMGDPASIGPEIAVKALLKEEIHAICKPLMVGDAKVFEQIIS